MRVAKVQAKGRENQQLQKKSLKKMSHKLSVLALMIRKIINECLIVMMKKNEPLDKQSTDRIVLHFRPTPITSPYNNCFVIFLLLFLLRKGHLSDSAMSFIGSIKEMDCILSVGCLFFPLSFPLCTSNHVFAIAARWHPITICERDPNKQT